MAKVEIKMGEIGGGALSTSYKQGWTTLTVPSGNQTQTYTPSSSCREFAIVSLSAILNYSVSGSMVVSINGTDILNTTTKAQYDICIILKKGDTLTVSCNSSANSYISYAEDYEMTSI